MVHEDDLDTQQAAADILMDSLEPVEPRNGIQGDKVMQDFESGSFAMGVDHSQKVKVTPIANDYGSKD